MILGGIYAFAGNFMQMAAISALNGTPYAIPFAPQVHKVVAALLHVFDVFPVTRFWIVLFKWITTVVPLIPQGLS